MNYAKEIVNLILHNCPGVTAIVEADACERIQAPTINPLEVMAAMDSVDECIVYFNFPGPPYRTEHMVCSNLVDPEESPIDYSAGGTVEKYWMQVDESNQTYSYLLLHEHESGVSWEFFDCDTQLIGFIQENRDPEEDEQLEAILKAVEWDGEYEFDLGETLSLYPLEAERDVPKLCLKNNK